MKGSMVNTLKRANQNTDFILISCSSRREFGIGVTSLEIDGLTALPFSDVSFVSLREQTKRSGGMKKFDKEQLAKARAIDLVQYLAGYGIQPSRISGNDFWYRSPFREENTPSFKVNRSRNLWYDFGEGRGGNLIDFAMQYHRISIGELMESLQASALLVSPYKDQMVKVEDEQQAIQIQKVKPLFSYALLNYLRERKVDIHIADLHCCELHYSFKQKNYYGIGFRNDLGGFEIRNRHFKSGTSPKGHTSIINGAKELCVFEGFFDFLSFRTLHQHLPVERFDYLVLNSLSFFEKVRPLMESYPTTRLYLDQNSAGRKFTTIALSLNKCYSDESGFYAGYDDLNDFHCHFGSKHLDREETPSRERKLKKGL